MIPNEGTLSVLRCDDGDAVVAGVEVGAAAGGVTVGVVAGRVAAGVGVGVVAASG